MWRRVLLALLVLVALCSLLWYSQVFGGEGYRVYVLSYIPISRPEMAVLKVVPEELNVFDVRDGLYGDTSLVGLRAGSTVIFNHQGTSLRVFEEAGGFVIETLASLNPWDEWRGGTMHAGQLIQQYVMRTGGFPETIEFERRIVHKQGVFVTGYTYVYRQWFRGYKGLGFGGIRITIGDGSLVHMLRSLHQVDGELGMKAQVISAREALRVAVRNTQAYTECSTRFFVHSVRLGYLTLWPEVRQESLEPVWEIRFSGHTVYVNAHSKEIMFGDGSRYSTR